MREPAWRKGKWKGGWGSSACATVDYEIFLSRFNTGTTLPKMKQRQTGLIRRSDSRSLSLLCIGVRLMLVSWTLSSRPDALDIRSDFGPDRYYVNFFCKYFVISMCVSRVS